MIISTANIADIAGALYDLLKDWPSLQATTIELGEPLNKDPSRCPWIGIYPVRMPFPPRALGFGAGYRGQEGEFIIIIQQTHATDGKACLQLLGEQIQGATSAILSDPTLKGTVLMLSDFEVNFLDVMKTNDAIFQTAAVRAVGVTTVSGG